MLLRHPPAGHLLLYGIVPSSLLHGQDRIADTSFARRLSSALPVQSSAQRYDIRPGYAQH